MKKFLVIIFLSAVSIAYFDKQIIKVYFSYKFSNWVEKKVIFDEFNFDYSGLITIKGLKILNSEPMHYDSIFDAKKIYIDFNLKSLIFSDLVIINNLIIEKSRFFLEIIEKKPQIKESSNGKEIIYEDNIGLAKKINEDLPDKIWPNKKRDVNFLILKSNISKGKAYIKVSSINEIFEIELSNFKFVNIGNHKDYQHYKDILKIMFFDVYASIEDYNLKELFKKIYNL